MPPVTAAGLLCACAAVLLTREQAAPRRHRYLALGCGSIVALLGILTLGEHAFQGDANLDPVWVDGASASLRRMSPQAGLSFAAFGTALIAFNLGGGLLRFGQLCAIATGANAIAATTSYIFGTPTVGGLPLTAPETAMAVNTGVSFTLLVSALFCRRPSDGIMTLVTSGTGSGAIARRLLLACIVMPPVVGGLTRIGVIAGWYEASGQGSLFVIIMASLVFWATWRTLRRAEREERQTRTALAALERANGEITRLYEKVTAFDEMKTQFFANVSHELRTPLTLILGPVETRLRSGKPLDAGLQRDLEVIDRNARTVLRHVNDLLDVARLDAGRLTPAYSALDAAAVMRAVADHFTALAAESDITCVLDAPESVPVQTDASMVQRVLANLLSNAFKFTPRGGRIRVSMREIDRRLHVEVGDSGPGIPVGKRTAVFERFHQLEGGLAPSRTGSGLGLSIVRDFVSRLGGTVSVGDAPEGGALFVVDLPSTAPAGVAVGRGAEGEIATDVGSQVAELRIARAAASGPMLSPVGGRVLVVEDNHEMNRFIVECLSGDGFDVATAFDGQHGFDRAVAELPDLIVTDVTLPVVSGDQLVRMVRQRPELASTPIVVLSGRGDRELRLRLLREGAQDYLEKPFSVAELSARARNLISRKRAHDDVDRLRRQLEAVARAGAEIAEAVANLPGESVRTVLHTIAVNARTLTGAELAAAGIGGDQARPFDLFAHVGMTSEQSERVGRLPRRIGVLGIVGRENVSIRIRDVRAHPEYRGLPPHHPPISSFLAVPIRFRGQVVGNLFLANKRGAPEFSHEDQHMAEMLAARAGSAVETARLYAAEGRAHAWLQAVVDQMPEGIVLMDAQGRITLENRSLQALTNVAPPASDRFGNQVTLELRVPFGDQLQPDELPIVRALLEREVTVGREYVVRTRGDQLKPTLVSAAPVLMEDGSLAGAVMVFQDISTMKELERLREEWASIVAHDLRQPISVIALRCSVLLRGRLSPAQRDGVEQIANSVHSLSRMVSDLMDASLLESDRLHVKLDRLDLGRLLHDVIERVPAARARTRTHVPEGLRVFVRGDAQRLEQVMANLLSNAAKYAAPETAIDVALHVDGANAQVTVANVGAGIPEDELPLVFHRFARSRTVGSSGVKGLGLGLYIAKGLVTAHHGQIWADSVPGGLTSFHFTIPLDGAPVPADTSSQSDAGSPSLAAQETWS